MNTDIRLSVGFWQHPKTKKTVKRLGLEGIRSLQILWLWSAVNRPDGLLIGMDWEDIELAADWQGEEKAFFAFCLEVWIDDTEAGYRLHDWSDHNPWQAEAEARSEKARKAANAKWEKEKAMQAHDSGNAQAMPGGCSSNAQAMQAHDSGNAPSPSPSPKALREDSSLRSESLSPDAEAPDDDSPEDSVTDSPDEDGAPLCPHKKIIALYHEVLPELARVKTWDEHREGLLRSRWRETWERLRKGGHDHDANALLAWWRKYFATVRTYPWLMGQERGRDGREFYATLEWLVRPRNYAKVLEGFYARRRPA